MGRAAESLREERRKVLGTYAAVCLGCGAGRRWFPESEDEVPSACPACGGELLRRCTSCSTPLSSLFTVDCESCGMRLREPVVRGMAIRRRGA